jgi:predicted nucleotidyltransferase component of viral defense system
VKPSDDLYRSIDRIRRVILTAIGADDVLAEMLVLKGGNALEIAHRIGKRASLDLDFSMEADFTDLQDAERRLFTALRERLDAAGLVLFDEKLMKRPPEDDKERKTWGGYRAEFKVISREKANALGFDREAMRRDSERSGIQENRTFTIEVSKYEYCGFKVVFEIDSFQLFVYPPDAIAAEKLRAICQQMPEYPGRRNPAPRPRDFYDIHALVNEAAVDFSDGVFQKLVRRIFDAKEVPCALIARIPGQREFHRQGESALRDSVFGPFRGFDFYFDFVVEETKKLKALGEE